MIEGGALFLGVRLRPNFRGVLTATNPSQFWRAWRGTMTNWLIRYVYIPLGGNRRQQTRNILAAFVVSTIWHCAGVPFLRPTTWQPMGSRAAGALGDDQLRRRRIPRGGAPPPTAPAVVVTAARGTSCDQVAACHVLRIGHRHPARVLAGRDRSLRPRRPDAGRPRGVVALTSRRTARGRSGCRRPRRRGDSCVRWTSS